MHSSMNHHTKIAEPRIAGQFSFGTHTAAVYLHHLACNFSYQASLLSTDSHMHLCILLHASVPKEMYPVIHAQRMPTSSPCIFQSSDACWWMCWGLDLVYIARHATAYAPSPGTIPVDLNLSCRWLLYRISYGMCSCVESQPAFFWCSDSTGILFKFIQYSIIEKIASLRTSMKPSSLSRNYL